MIALAGTIVLAAISAISAGGVLLYRRRRLNEANRMKFSSPDKLKPAAAAVAVTATAVVSQLLLALKNETLPSLALPDLLSIIPGCFERLSFNRATDVLMVLVHIYLGPAKSDGAYVVHTSSLGFLPTKII